MSGFALLRVETGRLLRSRPAWLAAGLTALAPLAGYSLYRPAIGDSMATLYLANPMLTGGLTGCVLFALLMLLTLERPRRSGTGVLTDVMVSPLRMYAVRLAAMLLLAVLTALAAGLCYLPYTCWKLDMVFSPADYALSVLLLFLSGPVMGALAACTVDQAVGRLDVSLTAVLAFLIFSRTIRGGAFLWQWSVPLAPALSDAFGSAVVWRTALYSRLVWLCLLGGLWLLSLLCVRQYGRGLLGSLLRHARRLWIPALALAMGTAGLFLWQVQPFVDHSPADWATAEETDRFNEALTLSNTRLEVSVESYLLGRLSGTAAFQLRNSSGRPQELYFELDAGYQVRTLTANGTPLKWEDLKKDFIASREVRCTLPADEEIALEITYGGMPKLWNAMESQLSGSVISGQNLELASMHLAPTVAGCVQVEEDAEAELLLTLKEELTAVTSGATEMVGETGDGSRIWRAADTGTDRFRLFAADYVEADLEGGGMPIQFYYSRKYQERLDGMDAIAVMEQVIAYCTEHYGPRSYTEDEPFKIIQMTVFEFGGFASSNLSGMGEVYFSDLNLSDPEKGSGSTEVLAHEIVHQWWGLGASLMDPGDVYWSDEGITTYTTYRIMCELMGEEYAYENYVEKWKQAVDDNGKNFYLRHPEYLEKLPERFANDIQAACRSANWYSGNALMIYRAAERLGREQVDAVWSRLYLEGGTELPPYITKRDFLDACGLKEGEIGRG